MLQMGEVYRYAKPYQMAPATIGGLKNFITATYTPGCKFALLEKGINPIAGVRCPDGVRIPAILISSSPHKIGSKQTPWHDIFDSDNGHILYFGDEKTPGHDPAKKAGNAALLAQFQVHASGDNNIRKSATPIIFFERVPINGVAKGFLRFHGFGVIERVNLITQFDQKSGKSFSNFAYDFTVLSLASEHELFDWSWISDRRNQSLNLSETLRHAPVSWRRWVTGGPATLSKLRRRVAKQRVLPKSEQQPEKNSVEEKILKIILDYYAEKKHQFELLASEVARRTMAKSGARYSEGWITQRSGDSGTDFVARLDIGTGFATTKLVVLGQAKCEALNTPTSGRDVARTVARLKRGWIGVYVTTSFFSDRVQEEIIEDQYPIMLIHGRHLAEEVARAANEGGHKTILDYLQKLDATYLERVLRRRPEEILLI